MKFIVLIPKSEIITEFIVLYETLHPITNSTIFLKAHVLGYQPNPIKEKLTVPLKTEVSKLIATKYDVLFLGQKEEIYNFSDISSPIISAIFSHDDIGQKNLALRNDFQAINLEDFGLGLENLIKNYDIPIIQKIEEAIQRKNYLTSHGEVVLIL